MATEIKKLQELEYDELVTLQIIENDKDLSEIFSDEVSLSFNMLRTLSKEGKLNQNTQDLIRELFDKVILTKTSLINEYVQLAKSDGKSIKTITPEVAPVEVPLNKDKKSPTKPRRYGKANIEEDIKKQGGKVTNAQLTALEVNDLKNLYVNLNTRLINDMLTDKPILSDEDYREIRSVITILKNKLRPIMKKK